MFRDVKVFVYCDSRQRFRQCFEDYRGLGMRLDQWSYIVTGDPSSSRGYRMFPGDMFICEPGANLQPLWGWFLPVEGDVALIQVENKDRDWTIYRVVAARTPPPSDPVELAHWLLEDSVDVRF